MDTRSHQYHLHALLHCWDGLSHRFGDRRLPSQCGLPSYLVLSTYCVGFSVTTEAHEDFVKCARSAHQLCSPNDEPLLHSKFRSLAHEHSDKWGADRCFGGSVHRWLCCPVCRDRLLLHSRPIHIPKVSEGEHSVSRIRYGRKYRKDRNSDAEDFCAYVTNTAK